MGKTKKGKLMSKCQIFAQDVLQKTLLSLGHKTLEVAIFMGLGREVDCCYCDGNDL